MARNPKAVLLTQPLKASATGQLPTEIEVVQTGEWHTPWHGDFDITTDDIDEAIGHFDAGVYRVNGTEPLPGTLDHLGGDSPAAFRINKVYRNGASMMASVTWTKLGEEKLERDEYRYISFEFFPRSMPYENPEKAGDVLTNVLTGATLTNDPLFKKLKPVMASVDAGGSDKPNQPEGGDMKLEEILAKKADERSDEEKTFVTEHKNELTPEQRKEAGIEETPAPTPEPAPEETQPQPETPKPEEPVQASANGGLSAAQIKQLQADAKAGREAMQQLTRTNLTASVKQAVDRGAIKSDQLNASVDLLMSLDDVSRAKVQDFIGLLPSNDLLSGEQGSSGGVSASAQDELNTKAAKLVADSAGKLGYTAALEAALAADSGLRDRVGAERSNRN